MAARILARQRANQTPISPAAGFTATQVEAALVELLAALEEHEGEPHGGGSGEPAQVVLLSEYVTAGTGLSQAQRIANVAGFNEAAAVAVAEHRELHGVPGVLEVELSTYVDDEGIVQYAPMELPGSVTYRGYGKGVSTIDCFPKDIVGLARAVTDMAFTLGSPVATSQTANFTTADEGKTLNRITGSGISNVFIDSVTNPTTVVMGSNASATSTGNKVQIGSAPAWLRVVGSSNTYRIKLSSFTMAGPTVTNDVVGDPLSDSLGISWSEGLTQGAIFEIENVEITGKFGTCVSRSGGGVFRIRDSDMNGYTNPVSFFESQNTSGEAENATLFVHNCVLTGVDGWSSSVGIYVHPHVNFAITGTVFRRFNRYAVYQNGNPNKKPLFNTITGGAMIDCAGVQTGEGTTTLNNVTISQNRYAAQQFTIYDDVIFTGCNLERCAGINSIGADSNEITFNNCRIRTGGTEVPFTISGDGAVDTWRFVQCEWFLAGSSAAMYIASSAGKVYIDGGLIDDATTGGTVYLFTINGGECWIDNLKVRNAKSSILVQGSTAAIHVNGLDFHGAGTTFAFAHATGWAAGQIDGEQVKLTGTATEVLANFSLGTAQQRLIRRRGSNPTTVASATTIDTNVAAWANHDVQVVTGSAAITTLDKPYPFVGIVRLVVAGGATWSTSAGGNIAPSTTSARAAGTVVSLLWEPITGKWLEV